MATDSFTPVSEHTKDRIWEEMYDIARYIQYYTMQTNKLSFLSKGLRVLLLVGAALVAGSGFQALPPAVGAGGAVFLLTLTVIDYVFDWGARAALAHAISLECCVIEKDYEDLWTLVRTSQISETESQARVNQLVMRVIAATAQLSDTDRGLNKKASKAAYKILEAKWGQASDNATRATTTSLIEDQHQVQYLTG